MNKRPRLELTWIGKEDRPRLEPRILLEDPELSYRAPKRVTDHDIFDNRLIHDDKGRRKDTAMQTLPLFASLDEGAKRRL
jgi:hypothetical protein